MSTSNREVVRTFVNYRPSDSPAIKLDNGTSTKEGQAYADLAITIDRSERGIGYDGSETFFLLIPIDKVNSLINDLLECIARHR